MSPHHILCCHCFDIKGELNLAGNDLIGPLPTTLGQLTSLGTFSCSLSLVVATAFSTHLTHHDYIVSKVDLMLWGNKIDGALPPELGMMTQLGKSSAAINPLVQK